MTPRRRTLAQRIDAWNAVQGRRNPDEIAAELRGETPIETPRGRPGDDLTLREIEVFLALVEHASAKQAAAALGITVRTVKNHLSNLYAKVGAEHMTHAAWLLWPMLKDAYVLPGQKRGPADRRTGYERRRSGRDEDER